MAALARNHRAGMTMEFLDLVTAFCAGVIFGWLVLS